MVDLMSESTNQAYSVLFEIMDYDLTGDERSLSLDRLKSNAVLAKLEVFRCRAEVNPEWLERVIEPAIEAGHLHSLDLCFRTGDEQLARARQQVGEELMPIPVKDLYFTFSEHHHYPRPSRVLAGPTRKIITHLSIQNPSWTGSIAFRTSILSAPILGLLLIPWA